jgi:FkbM family methyltransferase
MPMARSINVVLGAAFNSVLGAATAVKGQVARQMLRSPALWSLAMAPTAARTGVTVSRGDEKDPVEVSKGDRMIRIAARHRDYMWDVINSFDAFFTPVEATHEGERSVVDYSVPKEHVLRPSGERFFFTSIAESVATVDLYAEMGRLQRGSVVIDGGAYCGASAVLMGKIVGDAGRVIAFEPDAENYAALERNVATHRATNVTTSPKGLWSRSGTVEFQSDGNMGSSILEASGRAASRVASIPVTSLEDVVRDYKLDRLDFVKLDIEGAEVQVLEASVDVLRRFRPRVIIEAHLVNGELTTQRLCEIFASCGYKSHLLLEFPGAVYHLVLGVPG